MNRSRFNLSFRTGLLALISVTLILLSIRIFPNILPSLKMLDYRDVAVKSLTTEQMNALKGLKFTEGPVNGPNVKSFHKRQNSLITFF